MKVDSFDRSVVRTFDAELKALVADLAEKYGLTQGALHARFSPTDLIVKMKFTCGSLEKRTDNARLHYETYARANDMNPKWFGVEFAAKSGTKYKIVGIAWRRPKYPIQMVEVETGKEVKCTAQIVIDSMSLAVNKKVA